jgi:parvulin-like peptidyl-prolyl isomerase
VIIGGLKEVDASIKRQRQSSDGEISEKAYFDVTLDHFGWSPDEVREITARDLLKQKVAFRVDNVADKLRDKMVAAAKSEADFNKAAAKISAIDGVKVEVSETPLVPVNNRDDGLAEHASKLKVGDVSDVFKSTIRGDGYYIVKLLSREGDRISYVSMKAPLTVFQKKLSELRQNGGVKEYISVPTIEAISKSKN